MSPAEEQFVDHIRKSMAIANTVDRAFHQERLRTEFGWKQHQIAALYGCKREYVSMFQAISRLHPDVHSAMLIHRLSINTVLLLKDWNLETQGLFIKELIARGGRVTNKAARMLIRDHKRAARTESDLREFFRSLLKKEQPGEVHQFARDFFAFIDGNIDDVKMEHRLRRALSKN